MTNLKPSDYQQVLDEWCHDCLHFYDGGNYFEIPDRHMETIRSALQLAASPAPSVDDGYVMVPLEPTEEMIAAANVDYIKDSGWCYDGLYKAMIAAHRNPGEKT